MQVPFVFRCFGVFPPAYATFLISVTGLGIGSFGLLVLIVFTFMRDILSSITNSVPTNVQKAVVLTVGTVCLFLATACASMTFGVCTRSRGAVQFGVWMLLGMCSFILFMSVLSPAVCFFYKEACLVQKLPPYGLILLYLGGGAYVCVWLYFMVVAQNYLERQEDPNFAN